MIAPVTLSKTSIRNEWNFWRNAALMILLAVIAALGGDLIESAANPVIQHIRLGEPEIVKDGRLCWKYDGVKVRHATGVTYAAQVYESDYPKPTHRELTHLDGTPYGGPRSGAPPGPFSTHMCVRINHITRPYDRIGVRVIAEYQLDAWRPYLIRQDEIWRDYYPDKPETK